MTLAPEMTIKALLPWFGGKRTLAPAIVQELGQHTQYFEPFCGSMAVLFEKQISQKETVNDLHGDMVNLARFLQNIDQAEALYDRLQRVLLCEALLHDAGQYLEADNAASRDPFDWAYWYFLASWIQRNGVAGTDRQRYQIAVRWTKNGGSPAVRFKNAVESIPSWHHRLKNVVILHRDAFRILDRFEDCPKTAIYVDPPYLAESRTGFENTAGEHSRYRHEFSHHGDQLFGASDDHSRLRDILNSYRRARIVVSYYDCPRARQLYAGWNFVRHTMNKNLHIQKKTRRGTEESPRSPHPQRPLVCGARKMSKGKTHGFTPPPIRRREQPSRSSLARPCPGRSRPAVSRRSSTCGGKKSASSTALKKDSRALPPWPPAASAPRNCSSKWTTPTTAA